ncbi:MAG: KxYKxGKxW signal peptide domain-containing protein [Saprospiraceae bacterium]|nr:KxYKxGKxW signal peptide domain-containing protein [Saprospiraceae bacterium]MBK7811428.1 KxYKxGKxW signal peptide domain-containing protein [Saprospiraceae bacterium]MBK9631323.1 KxYKxGKxW signal peptide domain-containing protein [Saprospiraceae bacterium]
MDKIPNNFFMWKAGKSLIFIQITTFKPSIFK